MMVTIWMMMIMMILSLSSCSSNIFMIKHCNAAEVTTTKQQHTTTASGEEVASWTVETYPIPDQQPSVCRAGTSLRFCDPDGMIISSDDSDDDDDDDNGRKISTMIEDLLMQKRELSSYCTKKTKNPDNNNNALSLEVQIGVALLKKMDFTTTAETAPQEDTAVENMELFAQAIHDKWGVGINHDICGSTGVVLVVSELDRFVYISRGSALTSILTDHRLDNIIDRMKPILRQQLYGDAVIYAINEIDKLLQVGESLVTTTTKQQNTTTSREVATSWTVETYPIPDQQPSVCRAGTSLRFCDPDGMIISSDDSDDDDDNGRKISTMIEDLLMQKRELSSYCTKNTKNPDNNNNALSLEVQIGVALLKKMDFTTTAETAPQEDTAVEIMELFAQAIHDKWGVGINHDICGSTGVVLVVSELDRFVYISRGSALTSILTDHRLDYIIDHMKPILRQQLYGDAAIYAINEIDKLLQAGESLFWEGIKIAEEVYPWILYPFVFFGAFFWICKAEDRNLMEYDQVASQLNEIYDARANALHGRFQTKSCPICLEKFIPTTMRSTTSITSSTQQQEKEGIQSTSTATILLSPPPPPPATATTTLNENTVDDNNSAVSNEQQLQQMPRSEQQEALDSQTCEPERLMGSDGLELKVLRCGHVFDITCWEEWIASGHGKVDRCPICQQDVGPVSTTSLGGSRSRCPYLSFSTVNSRSNSISRGMQHFNSPDSNVNSRRTDGYTSPQTDLSNRNIDNAESSSTSATQPLLLHQYQTRMHGVAEDEEEAMVRQQRLLSQYTHERDFRLMRLAARYPRSIRHEQIQQWKQVHCDGPLARDPTFSQNDPALHNTATSNSGSSSRKKKKFSFGRKRSGFGGGRSSGGRGGIW